MMGDELQIQAENFRQALQVQSCGDAPRPSVSERRDKSFQSIREWLRRRGIFVSGVYAKMASPSILEMVINGLKS